MDCQLEIGITMNKAQEKAILDKISYLEDNKYRYEVQAKKDPTYVTGNGELASSVAVSIQAQIDELKEPMNA